MKTMTKKEDKEKAEQELVENLKESKATREEIIENFNKAMSEHVEKKVKQE